MRALPRLPLVLLLLLAAGPPARPQAQAPDAPQATPPQTQTAQPRFRAGTTVITVDAIVRNRDGRFVTDLKPGDFEVLENGKPQTIESFYVVIGGRTLGGPTPEVVPPVAPLEPTAPRPPQVQRVFVLLFDQAHMAPGSFKRAQQAAASFLETDFHEGDVGGVVNGGTMIGGRLTSSREELQAAVRTITPSGDERSHQLEMRDWPRFVNDYEAWRIAYGDDNVLNSVWRRACLDDPDRCRPDPEIAKQIVQNKARRLVDQLRADGQRTIHTLSGLASGLAKVPGRKTIVLLSGGFFAEDSWGDLQGLTGLAARASVRIYALDTRGLNRGSASSDILDMPPHSSVNPAEVPANFDVGADAPNALAVDTGGLMIRNENNFTKAFQEIADDTSSYYVLGYAPSNTDFDGKFRNITVRVTRPGLDVRARKGYLATPDLAAAAPAPAEEAATSEPAPAAVAPPEPAAVAPQPEPPAAAAPAAPQPTEPPAVVTPPSEPPAAPPSSPPEASAASGAASGAAPAARVRPGLADEVKSLDDLAAGAAGPSREAGMPPEVARQASAGWNAYQRGDVEGARAALGKAAASPAAAPWVRYTLGWSAFALGDYPAATAAWEEVREAVPVFESVYFDLADGYLQQREFGKAIAVLRDAQARWKDDVEILNAVGVVQTARGAVNDAIESFQAAVALAPGDATSCFNLAKTYEWRYAQMTAFQRMYSNNPYGKDRDQAIEYYRRTVQLGGPLAESARAALKRLEGRR